MKKLCTVIRLSSFSFALCGGGSSKVFSLRSKDDSLERRYL